MKTADFNRFSIHLPESAVSEMSHAGPCDADVARWAQITDLGEEATPEAIRAELKECGAWDEEELADDEANIRRILWIAAGNIREEEAA